MKEKIAIENIISKDEMQEEVDNIVIIKNNIDGELLSNKITYRGFFMPSLISINILEMANHLFFGGKYKLNEETTYDVEKEMKRILEKGVQKNANKKSK